ncbi:mitochondrial protein import protein ZIM17 [Entomortierella parvispora]|uniref:Mitochondrial protein import protein ZIM17 n=1 Tax=Entomortierella parvispora TaxID=205924 RepID=A0A9P3M240_9FUNG|nr:mitochondrial protein import protein ZIM17 [Entomortierella parvispora]
MRHTLAQAPTRLSSLIRAIATESKAIRGQSWTNPSARRLVLVSQDRNLTIPARPLLNLLGHSEPGSSFSLPAARSVLLRPYHVSIRTLEQQRRHDDTSAAEDPSKHQPSTKIDDHIQPQHKNPIPPNLDPKARMLIGFTCTVCNHRSHKTMSKHAYQHGVVIMRCDGCKNKHLIADHLGWFKNGGVTVEDLVKENGETVQKLTRDYQLLKNGSAADSVTTPTEGDASLAHAHADTKDAADKIPSKAGATATQKTELELALEKASEGMLEWIPKDILQQEEEKMEKSRRLVKEASVDKKDS